MIDPTHSQNAALNRAIDARGHRKAVATFAVETVGYESYTVIQLQDDGSEVLVPMRRAIVRSVRLEVA